MCIRDRIKINTSTGYDFEVDYYNADGSQSFCGNGARCAVAFAHELGVTQAAVSFLAIAGPQDSIFDPESQDGKNSMALYELIYDPKSFKSS